MGELLKVEDINVYYGSIHAIKDVSFHVDEGEIVTMIDDAYDLRASALGDWEDRL